MVTVPPMAALRLLQPYINVVKERSAQGVPAVISSALGAS
jgi:hypothetical protein